MLLPKSPHPIFAYRFACDYANEESPILTFMKICEGRAQDLLHPANPAWNTDDQEMIKRLIELSVFKRRREKVVYAIETSNILKQLVGVTDLYYPDDTGWIEYSTLGDHVFGIEGDIELFENQGVQLIRGKERELIALLGRQNGIEELAF